MVNLNIRHEQPNYKVPTSQS